LALHRRSRLFTPGAMLQGAFFVSCANLHSIVRLNLRPARSTEVSQVQVVKVQELYTKSRRLATHPQNPRGVATQDLFLCLILERKPVKSSHHIRFLRYLCVTFTLPFGRCLVHPQNPRRIAPQNLFLCLLPQRQPANHLDVAPDVRHARPIGAKNHLVGHAL